MSIESNSAEKSAGSRGLLDVNDSGRVRKGKFVLNRHTRRAFLAQFYGLGISANEAARRTGHPLRDGEEQIRQIGRREWLRRTGQVA